MNIQNISLAVQAIRRADGILITAGAGMGVDSGLPDFRGDRGMWRAYPALGRARMGFSDIANPKAFIEQPRLAWGFYGHRLNLYRRTVPHAGFGILQQISARMEHGAFVITSNVDGHFQRAGFGNTRVNECHGSINFLQCSRNCSEYIWPADDLELDVDEAACELRSDLPTCPNCGELSRPNVLMFGDWGWQSSRTDMQDEWFRIWRQRVKQPVVIELGAGTAIATVRRKGESIGAPLIRINPDEAITTKSHHISLQAGALAALTELGTAIGI